MQLTSHSTNQDLTTLIDFLCDSDSNSFTLQNKVLNMNAFYEELVGEIIGQDGTWQFDDTNFSTEPVGTGTLVADQQRYSFTSEYLDISMVEVLNADGTRYEKILPLDHTQLGDMSPEEYFGTDSSGNPTSGKVSWYDKHGDTIYLYYSPNTANHTMAAGLRIWFKRTVDLFTTSDTTQEPAFPSTHHAILAYGAAIPYCAKYHKDRVPLYEKRRDEMKKSLLAYYGKRERDTRKRAEMEQINFI